MDNNSDQNQQQPEASSQPTDPQLPPPTIQSTLMAPIDRLVDKFIAFLGSLSQRKSTGVGVSPMPQPAFHRPGVNRKMILPGLVGIVLFFLLAWLSIACIATYSRAKIPFVSDKGRRDLIVGLYKVPFLPRTAEQVLLVAVEKNTKINSYSPDFSFSARMGASSVSLGSVDFHVKGPVDFTPDKKTSMDLTGQAQISLAGKSYQLDGKLRKVEDKIYFKLDKLPDALLDMYSSFGSYSSYYGGGYGYSAPTDTEAEKKEISENINRALINWIVYDNGGLDSEARKNLDKGDETSVINSVRKNTQDFLLKSNILPEVKREKDEKIDGVDSYHLSLTPSKALIKKIFLEYALSDKSQAKTYYTDRDQKDLSLIANAIDSVHIDAYFAKGDLVLNKTSLNSQIKLDSFNTYGSSALGGAAQPSPLLGIIGVDSLVNARLSISTVMLARDINKPVKVATPSPVKTYQEFTEILTDAFKTKKQKAQQELLSKYQADFTKIQYYLTRYYVEKGNYPSSLNEIVSYIPEGDGLTKTLSLYTYKTSPNNRDFIVYVVLQNAVVSAYTTPYYGFSSRYQATRQLEKFDFDEIIGSPYSSSPPYYSPSYR